MFWMRNKETTFPIRTLVWRPALYFSIIDLPEEYRGLFTSNTLHQLQDGPAINNAQHLQDGKRIAFLS